MKPSQTIVASLAGLAALALSGASLADPATPSDTVTAAVEEQRADQSPRATVQRALAAHLHLWTAADPAQYPYEFLLADRAVYEFPYAASPSSRRIEGKTEIAEHLRGVAQRATDWKFSDVRLFSTLQPNVYFASFAATAFVRETGRPYRQTYMVRMTMDGERIANLFVLWDDKAQANALADSN